MQIRHSEGKSGGRYTVDVEGYEAYISYSRTSPRLIIVDHTEVPDALRGRGIGQALSAHVVEEARTGNWKIIALCPFFKSQVMRHPDWNDVLA